MKRIVCICFVFLSLASHAQEALKPRPSPLAKVTTKYKDTYLSIIYSQPQKKGREIFGNLVPFGQVWRTGANEATEMTITRPVTIGGKELKAALTVLDSINVPLNGHATRDDHELKNLHSLAKLITRSAIGREESRGSHYRSDFPYRDDDDFQKHSVVTKNAEVTFEK